MAMNKANRSAKISAMVVLCLAAQPHAVLHVKGRFVYDNNDEQVIFRGIEHVIRWGEYKGSAPWGDNPWEGGANDVSGNMLAQIAKTKTNAVRILGGKPDELENILKKAIVEHKMWVSIARVNWRDAKVIAAIKKYADYVTLHAVGEVNHRDENKWKNDAINVIKKMRELGYTSPIEIYSTGYGQTLTTILNKGEEVFNSDPDKNVLFGFQLYSEHAKDVAGTLNKAANFKHPIMVGACLFNLGIKNGWGNNQNTYKQVWDGTYSRSLSSYYWDWYPDGEGNAMSSNGSYNNLTAIGKYLVKDSPAALEKTSVKSAFLLNEKPTSLDYAKYSSLSTMPGFHDGYIKTPSLHLNLIHRDNTITFLSFLGRAMPESNVSRMPSGIYILRPR